MLQEQESRLGACLSGAREQTKGSEVSQERTAEAVKIASAANNKARADAAQAISTMVGETGGTSRSGDFLGLAPSAFERMDMLEGEYTQAMGEYAKQQFHHGPVRDAIQEDKDGFEWVEVLSPEAAMLAGRSTQALTELQEELHRLQQAETLGEAQRCEAALLVHQSRAAVLCVQQHMSGLPAADPEALRFASTRFVTCVSGVTIR
jgi:hypothetical protein